MIGPGAGLWPSVIGAPPAGPGPAPRPLLLIVAGQSNAGKEGTSGLTPPAEYAGLDIGIWDNVSAFAAYVPGANGGDYPAAWGSEAGFVRLLRQTGSIRPVYLVKRAAGATPVSMEAGPDWHPASSGEMFATLKARVLAARAAILAATGQAPEEVTLWNQGERDIQDNARAAAFAGNFATFLSEYRAQISAGLFILERTRPFPGWFANGFAVRKAQLDAVAADGNARAIDCDFDAADPWDTLHPGPDWCEGIGARAFAAWNGSHDSVYGSILDAVPAPFAFAGVTGAAPSGTVVSEIVTPAGFGRDCALSVTGGEYRLLHPDDTVAADWTAAAGRLHRWQKLQVRLTAAAGHDTAASLTLTAGGVAAVWTVTTGSAPAGVASLFSAGEEGAWLDPSDLSTLFQDVAGTIPVTADGQPVGRMLDRSGRGHHVIAAGDDATRPTFRDSGGRRWIEFDGSGQRLAAATRFGTGANPDLAVTAALRVLSRNSGTDWVFTLGATNASGTLNGAAGDLGWGWFYGGGNEVYGPVTNGIDQVASWVHPAGGSYGSSSFFLDGTEAAHVSQSNPAGLPANTAALFQIGWRADALSSAHLRLYGMVVQESADPARRATAEAWAAGLF